MQKPYSYCYNYVLLAVFLTPNNMENLLSKEELKKQLKLISEKENQELIEKHYPEFKKLEGKCFKNRNNYSCPEKPSDYWWLYTKITEIKPEDLYDTGGNGVACHYKGYSFQTDKDGNVSTQKIDYGYVHSLQKEISEKEFDKAFENMISALNELSKQHS